MTNSLPDLPALLDSWVLALHGERKASGTVTNYRAGVRAFLSWCDTTNTPPVLAKAAVQGFVADLLANGAEPATARARQLAVRRFSAWLTAEGEQDTDPLLGLKQPKIDTKVTHALTDDQLKALIRACQGKSLVDRRDEAIVRLLAETGMRAAELVALHTDDIDLQRGLAVVRRGKGGKGRIAPFGPQTAAAIDRYLRARRATPHLSNIGMLWVGGARKTFGYHGLDKTLKRRAEMAGIKHFHIHLMRHTAATRWLRHGGTEGGLMAVAGWRSRDMLDRYTEASAGERAAAEARRLNLGDL